MDDATILGQVHELVAEEHELRERAAGGEVSTAEERARLGQLEEALDQCWDLLRRRRARRDAGQDPDAETSRPVTEVEGYLQ
jgi:hypothetical protein